MHNYVHTLENYIIKKVCVLCAESLQWYLTLCNPMVYSLPDPSVHGISQVRILEWVAISFSKESSNPGI